MRKMPIPPVAFHDSPFMLLGQHKISLPRPEWGIVPNSTSEIGVLERIVLWRSDGVCGDS